ncbi:MAG: phosphoribosylaminoimidazolesuccinocarboxamide synthase [bacterium]
MDINKGKTLVNKDEKSIHATDDEKYQIIHFKETLPNKDKKNVTKIKGKGRDNCSLAVGLYKYLKSYNIPTYFKKQIQPNEILINKVDMIPVKISIWNIASGDFKKNYKIKKGEFLKCPVIEYYLNDKQLNFPMINMDHIIAFDCATGEECRVLDIYTRKINAVLKSYFERRGYKLGKFELEFGRWKDGIILASDVTPDNCQLWDIRQQEKRWFYLNKKNVLQAYKELMGKLL